jgi:plasmid maintenance system antidote protein VapI
VEDKKMMELEIMRARLKDMNLAGVARTCGVSRELLSRFMRGGAPFGLKTYLKLERYFAGKEQAVEEIRARGE